MKILVLGDVVGASGLDAVCKRLPRLRSELAPDAVIVNGENAAMGRGNGLTAADAENLFAAGADVVTGGNHSFRQRNIYALYDESARLLRPGNYHGSCPGRGHTILPVSGRNMLVVNLAGRVNMDPCDNPFETLDKILKAEKDKYDFAVVDFHAEATSEKIALAFENKDRVSVFFGTHTHVPTADERVLPGGCGYITDVGMCGPSDSALGVKVELIIEKLKTGMPCRFEISDNPVELQGAVFTIDDKTLRCKDVKRIKERA